jgi:hypothetical protein
MMPEDSSGFADSSLWSRRQSAILILAILFLLFCWPLSLALRFDWTPVVLESRQVTSQLGASTDAFGVGDFLSGEALYERDWPGPKKVGEQAINWVYSD